MKFDEIVPAVGAQIVVRTPDFSTKVLKQVVACDLMSDVLVSEAVDFLLVTSLPSEQTARTADMVGAQGILLVNDKDPQPGLLKLAQELEIPLLTTALSSFETCVALGKILRP